MSVKTVYLSDPFSFGDIVIFKLLEKMNFLYSEQAGHFGGTSICRGRVSQLQRNRQTTQGKPKLPVTSLIFS